MKKWSFALCTLIGLNAWGQSGNGSAYSFGGACSSQGTWTQSALQATQSLRKITNQLKNDENCNVLGKSMAKAIEEMNASLKEADEAPTRVKKMSEIPREISALQSVSGSTPGLEKTLTQLMMDKAIEGAAISAEVGSPIGKNPLEMVGAFSDFGDRLRQSTSTGITLLNNVIDDIPSLNECLMGDQAAALGAVFTTSAKLAAAYAGSGQDGIGSQLAMTISKLAKFQRDSKFSKVIRHLNKQEFLASMSCLMEVTSESYCQTMDGMTQFKQGMENLMNEGGKLNKVESANPLAGFYILNIHVPNVTQWLQKIQIGVDPKLPTDAAFQNKILDEVVDYQKDVKRLLGDYNLHRGTILSLNNLAAQQNGVIKMINVLSDQMLKDYERADRTNFFQMSRTPVSIPFYLLGMQVPAQVLGALEDGKFMQKLDYDEWLQANYQKLPIFQDPKGLVDAIGVKLKGIIQEASVSSIEYFNKWFIVDKAALVNESTIDVQYSVKESLVEIEKYLAILQDRMVDLNGDASITPTILDTRARIQRILDKYEVISNLGKSMKGLNPKDIQDETVLLRPIEAYEDLINTVYEEFYVQLARSGFLANRMTNFVKQDYVLLVHNKVNFAKSQQDLIRAVGMTGLEKMLRVYAGNPANVQTDLNLALRINKSNIEALDDLLSDQFMRMIGEVKMVVDGGNSTFWNSLKRLAKDSWKESTMNMPGLDSVSRIRMLPDQMMNVLWKHSDRYEFFGGRESVAPDSEFKDASAVLAQLCIQSLAFTNPSRFVPYCSGVVLESPLKKYGGKNIEYNKRVTKYSTNLSEDLEKRSADHSKRICSFREYNIQNMVLYMTMGKKR